MTLMWGCWQINSAVSACGFEETSPYTN